MPVYMSEIYQQWLWPDNFHFTNPVYAFFPKSNFEVLWSSNRKKDAYWVVEKQYIHNFFHYLKYVFLVS